MNNRRSKSWINIMKAYDQLMVGPDPPHGSHVLRHNQLASEWPHRIKSPTWMKPSMIGGSERRFYDRQLHVWQYKMPYKSWKIRSQLDTPKYDQSVHLIALPSFVVLSASLIILQYDTASKSNPGCLFLISKQIKD